MLVVPSGESGGTVSVLSECAAVLDELLRECRPRNVSKTHPLVLRLQGGGAQ